MTLKKMSVAANDIALNNLVMRGQTFRTAPRPRRPLLLNAHFRSAQRPCPGVHPALPPQALLPLSPGPSPVPETPPGEPLPGASLSVPQPGADTQRCGQI